LAKALDTLMTIEKETPRNPWSNKPIQKGAPDYVVDYEHTEDFKRLEFILTEARRLPKGSHILDLGCGTGNNARALAAAGYKVTGIDIDLGSLDIARQRSVEYGLDVAYEHVDADKMDVKEPYDAVLLSEVLEHLHEPNRMLHLLKRLVKPGGMAIITVPNGFGPREVFMTRPQQFIYHTSLKHLLYAFKRLLGYKGETAQSANPDLEHLHFFTKRSLIRFVSKEGFQLLRLAKADSIDRVFPYSMLANRIMPLQRLDGQMADLLPSAFTSGLYSSWSLPESK
jgi:2-polyprenyl-3-methyl-5-hydroxy-6-metoxy-1,4-benzoquinol methylase